MGDERKVLVGAAAGSKRMGNPPAATARSRPTAMFGAWALPFESTPNECSLGRGAASGSSGLTGPRTAAVADLASARSTAETQPGARAPHCRGRRPRAHSPPPAPCSSHSRLPSGNNSTTFAAAGPRGSEVRRRDDHRVDSRLVPVRRRPNRLNRGRGGPALRDETATTRSLICQGGDAGGALCRRRGSCSRSSSRRGERPRGRAPSPRCGSHVPPAAARSRSHRESCSPGPGRALTLLPVCDRDRRGFAKARATSRPLTLPLRASRRRNPARLYLSQTRTWTRMPRRATRPNSPIAASRTGAGSQLSSLVLTT